MQKQNRALLLRVPNLDEDLDDLIEISINIAKSYNLNFEEINKNKYDFENSDDDVQIFEIDF